MRRGERLGSMAERRIKALNAKMKAADACELPCEPLELMSLIAAQKESRETVAVIADIRDRRAKLRIAELTAARKLGAVDQALVDAEIGRMMHERLAMLDGKELYQLATERLEEERKEYERASGLLITQGDAS